ncbi:MAG: HPr kinase/phosphatase C-terminal domain-containing protein, partial [Alphaproteobacteria bacterium]|nr:HPr kinase/phosphatase C-terminal domain-containing protein [Alphaproteobacteria bacterium]
MLIHATTICIGSTGVILTGRSGCGKSDLALRMIDRGAQLVSDDYTELSVTGDRLLAKPPQKLAGLIELRGVGIIKMPYIDRVCVGLCVELDNLVERM